MYKENMNYENQQRMIFDIVNEFGNTRDTTYKV